MCGTCGCGQPGPAKIINPRLRDNHSHSHEHLHDHDGFSHSHLHSHTHENPAAHDDHDHNHDHDHHREINLEIDIMQRNNLLAERNRGYFEARQITALNMVSSPGSGKTTILERTVKEWQQKDKVYIIEGDQQTTLDADRISGAGAPVVQINTGNGCHLDARMINEAVKSLNVSENSLLIIENVGNLVCPALFDLGEKRRVVIISVTEGQDKPLKYPNMFQSSDICLINKSDLLPYVDFDLDVFKEYAKRINHHLEFITLSARTGEGFEQWLRWLESLTVVK